MKKLFLALFLVFLSTIAYADTAILQSADGNAISASNPLQVTAIGSGEDPAVIFNVKTEYGAKGDGITKFDGNTTATSATFTSATASFTSVDVGKVITITNAGGAGVDQTTTIASVNSGTSIELTDVAVATVADAIFTYGTDDTTAIRNAVAAVGNASPPVGTVYFPQGIYIVNGAFDQTDGTQIAFPTKLSTATPYFQTTVKLKGPIFPKSTNFYGFNSGGAIIYSTRNGTSGQAIIGGKGTGGASSFTDIRVDIEDMTFRTVQNPTNNGIDLLYINSVIINNLYVEAGLVLNNSRLKPTSTGSYGVVLPGTQNNNTVHMTNARIQGFYNGLAAGEHTSAHNLAIFYTVNGLVFATTNVHNSYFGNLAIERTINNIVCSAASSFIIANVDMENAGNSLSSWYENDYDYSDPSSQCTGSITYFIQDTEGGSATFTTNGGKGVSIFGYQAKNYKFKTSSTFPTFNIINTGNGSATNGALLTLIQDDSTPTNSGQRLGAISFGGSVNSTSTYLYGASIQSFADEDFGSSDSGGHLRLLTTLIGDAAPTERVRILSNGNVGIGITAPSGMLVVNPPAAQTIAAGNTVLGDSCGTAKLITAAGAVTTDTTNTFTAPAAGNEGCCMDVINVGAENITLDNNANFVSAGAADVVLGAGDTARVCSTGASGKWYQVGATGNN